MNDICTSKHLDSDLIDVWLVITVVNAPTDQQMLYLTPQDDADDTRMNIIRSFIIEDK